MRDILLFIFILLYVITIATYSVLIFKINLNYFIGAFYIRSDYFNVDRLKSQNHQISLFSIENRFLNIYSLSVSMYLIYIK